jgi:hypothetical protein
MFDSEWLKYNFDTREWTTQESQCTVVAQREGLSNVRAKNTPPGNLCQCA